MIKFKEAGNGNFIRISMDEAGKELSRTATFSEASKPGTMGAGFWQEMQAWIEAGNVVEPQYTAEELVEKEAKDAADFILNANSNARAFLNSTDWKVIRHNDQIANSDATSLTDAEYKALLTERQTARNSVIED